MPPRPSYALRWLGSTWPRISVVERRPGGLRNRVFCSSCRASAIRRHGVAPLGWEEMPDKDNQAVALCPSCVRRNLWLIEARLEIDFEAGPGPSF